ncbi:MAG: peptidyl-prolyl cis-trans isomerase [Nitrospirae bacterium]|nr:peptidyl-prolyl cis-trans isomerase [Nitrospirota bacterium]
MARYPFGGGWQIGKRRRRSAAPLAATVLLGAAVAAVAAGLWWYDQPNVQAPAWPAGVAAVVNGREIPTADVERRAADEPRSAGSAEEASKAVLDTLIEETLLIERAASMDLVRGDPVVKARLLDLLAERQATASAPTEETLRAYYASHLDRFTGPLRVDVDEVYVPVSSPESAARALEKASEAAARLRQGEPYSQVVRALGDRPPRPLPRGVITIEEFTKARGQAAARSAAALAKGQVADPQLGGSGYSVYLLSERLEPEALPYEEVVESVRRAYAASVRREALEQLAVELRRTADVRLPPGGSGEGSGESK